MTYLYTRVYTIHIYTQNSIMTNNETLCTNDQIYYSDSYSKLTVKELLSELTMIIGLNEGFYMLNDFFRYHGLLGEKSIIVELQTLINDFTMNNDEATILDVIGYIAENCELSRKAKDLLRRMDMEDSTELAERCYL